MYVLHREDITSQHIVLLLYELVSFQIHAELNILLLLSNLFTFFITTIYGKTETQPHCENASDNVNKVYEFALYSCPEC